MKKLLLFITFFLPFTSHALDRDETKEVAKPQSKLLVYVNKWAPASYDDRTKQRIAAAIKKERNIGKQPILEQAVRKTDYGYGFPSSLYSQGKLLQWSKPYNDSQKPKLLIDVGPGFGGDLWAMVAAEARVIGVETLPQQALACKKNVSNTLKTIFPSSDLSKNYHIVNSDIVNFFANIENLKAKNSLVRALSEKKLDGGNLNKIIHFLTPKTGKKLFEYLAKYSRSGAEFHVTVLTPSSKEEKTFMAEQKKMKNPYPGFAYQTYGTLSNKLIEIKAAPENAIGGFFKDGFPQKENVIFYQDVSTLAALAGSNFTLKEHQISMLDNTGNTFLFAILKRK